MGAASSRIEEDKSLKLCRERKKFVRQALDGRCSLAATHVTYIQSLRNTGTILRKFIEPEAPIRSSLYDSTSATPEPLSLIQRSLSHFSAKNLSQYEEHMQTTQNVSLSPFPPVSNGFQVNHMKFKSSYSKKVEEVPPPLPIVGTVSSFSIRQNTVPSSTKRNESSSIEPTRTPTGTPPWDYFGFSHPIDRQFSQREGQGTNKGLEKADNEEHSASFDGAGESQDSEDEFDVDSVDNLVRSFDNLNRINDKGASTPSAGSVASEHEFLNWEKNDSPILSPLGAAPAAVTHSTDTKKTPAEEDCFENKVTPKDFLSSVKDIEYLFIKASESGKEVPRMLEVNKLHFRPVLQGKESGSVITCSFFKECFSCGEESIQAQDDPDHNSVKYLTWHRTTSSRSSSSRHPAELSSKYDTEDLNSSLFDNFCMVSGSHASTLDRLYAWERKLYDEVKASQVVRRDYDLKCEHLRQQESKGESTYKIDKTRAIVKDLHSRIKVSIHRIDSISKRIEELRDKELQPQLEELIGGLSRMWEVMLECHKLQFQIISVTYNSHTKIYIESESHREIAIHLENELKYLSYNFTKWITGQESYLKSINGWLTKCVLLPQNFSKRKRRLPPPPLRDYGPPIYFTCDEWLKKLQKLPSKEVSDSIKGLAGEISRFLPRQEKTRKGESDIDSTFNQLKDEVSEETFNRFLSSLVAFLGQLHNYSGSSVNMYKELELGVETAKSNYEQRKSQ